MSLPALLGGVPVADAETYPSWPQWGEREREELLATLDSGAWWTGDGERAFRFAQGVRALPGRSRRLALHERHADARGCTGRLRRRRGRRGDRARDDLRRERERSPLGQRHARDRRRRPLDALHRRRRGRGCDHTAHARRHRCARGRRRLRPRPARAALRAQRAAPDRGLRARARLAMARPGRRQLRLVRQLLHAARQAHDGRRGRRADRQRRSAAGRGLELRRLRARAWPLVLSPRDDRLQLPHDRVAGRRPARPAGALSRAARRAQRQRDRAGRGAGRGSGPARPEARRAHGQPGQLLLRRALRLERVRRHAATPLRGGACTPTACRSA